jgi:hypothetical protein
MVRLYFHKQCDGYGKIGQTKFLRKFKECFFKRLAYSGEDWELVGQGYQFTEGTAANDKGDVFYQDIPASKTYKVELNGKLNALNIDAKKANGTCFGADGKRYTISMATKQLLSYDKNEKEILWQMVLQGMTW